MVAQPIRAVYEHGQLRLLDPVNLAEGEVIQVVILTERERARAALADISVRQNPEIEAEDEIDEAALQAEIDAATKDIPPVSDAVIEERQEGP
jgi:predicted DNA-binding antitoxin AbrB/MazE fold protein